MKKYPKEYLEEIKLRLKVSNIVGKSVQLKKRGKEFVGLSPFKNEKTPSFTVNDEKGFYHCFSSGEHGNIFDFLMKTQSIGFGEAVKSLALEAGLQPYRFSDFDEKREKRFITYKNIYKDYLDFFSEQLFDKENNEALNYLKKRSLDEKIIKEFKLGYVPWNNNFYKKLLAKYSEEEIKQTGLYYLNEKKQKFVDRFNSRIIFPINNLRGETIAFGGRILKSSNLAKYINSPETEFYKKGKTVFNLDNAKSNRSQTDEVIIVEGYMDVLSLYSNGFKNVVSNSGIAITETQIDLIWKFFSSPVVCLDGDSSGQAAAIRAAERLIPQISENKKIYFVVLPEGQDPDEVIKKTGKEKFTELLNSKVIIQSFIWESYIRELKDKNPFTISNFEKKIRSMCRSIKDETLRKYILEDFLQKIRSFTPIQNSKKPYTKIKDQNVYILKETKKITDQKNHLSKEELKEQSILFILINYPDASEIKLEELSEIKFSSEKNETLKKDLLKIFSSKEEKDKLKNDITNKEKIFLKEIEKNVNLKVILDKKNIDEIEKILSDLIFDLQEMGHIKKIESLEKKLVKNLDENSYSELIKLKNQLNRD